MAITVRLRIQITNPPWKKVFIDFIRNFVVPFAPFFRSIASGYKAIHDAIRDIARFLAGIILIIFAIPFGIIVLSVLFGIPVILFCVAMGWIK